MVLEKTLKDQIIALIAHELGQDLDANIVIDSFEVLEDAEEIRIRVRIETDASPEVLARRYFGLTGSVREVMGDRWKNFFPVITPLIGHPMHA